MVVCLAPVGSSQICVGPGAVLRSKGRHPVTNERFARFVATTGHVTFAEIPPNPADYPGALSNMLYAGSLVFFKPERPVDRNDIGDWWRYERGANWRHPKGAESSNAGLERQPVVHVTFGYAEAFAKCEGKQQLPADSSTMPLRRTSPWHERIQPRRCVSFRPSRTRCALGTVASI
jgi:hypothetical protein